MRQNQNCPELKQPQTHVTSRAEHTTDGRGQTLLWPPQHACRPHRHGATLGESWRWGSLLETLPRLVSNEWAHSRTAHLRGSQAGTGCLKQSFARGKTVSQLQVGHAELNPNQRGILGLVGQQCEGGAGEMAQRLEGLIAHASVPEEASRGRQSFLSASCVQL